MTRMMSSLVSFSGLHLFISPKKYGWTGVFWDMDDFTLPPGLGVDQFVKNVCLAISNEGARGDVEFFAYSSSDSFDYGRYLESKSFTPAKVVSKRSRFYRLSHCMLNWVHKRRQYGGKKNVLVIAKAMPGEDNINLISFLDEMTVRDHNVFTVVPEGCSPENFDYPEPILAWYWSSLCSGSTSIDLSSAYPTTDDDSGSSSPETDRAQGVKRASETDATVGSPMKRGQKDADSQN
ncbi:hypothetical protein Bca52824_055593 [Brassica carinata]|uniref:NYN domain-containing protein n=1 Tax=Brassica carinata TaxID=52824 RepID=A0A8X7RCU6_BRACI|nr:hypothetical protein Bca52824_055593 [Brassica carinata]